MQRAMGRRKENPSLYDVGYNDNTIRNSKTFKPIDGTNCEGEVDVTLSIEKLPSKKKRSRICNNYPVRNSANGVLYLT